MKKFWIADSGSTKTDWRLCENGKAVLEISTPGINPVYQDEAGIAKIAALLQPNLTGRAGAPLYFYGAGVINTEKADALRRVLSNLFKGIIEIDTDMVGAARALCGNKPGIACILGTGSNSCFYNGRAIERNVPPLGFILGDEGSGAVIGKLFIADLLKDRLPDELKTDFLDRYQLTPSDIINRVYREPLPNRFLAAFAPYIVSVMEQYGEVELLVKNSVEAFFTRNVMQYNYKNHPVYFTGSVAYNIKNLLHETAKKYNIQIGEIIASPTNGLICYHS